MDRYELQHAKAWLPGVARADLTIDRFNDPPETYYARFILMELVRLEALVKEYHEALEAVDATGFFSYYL